MIPEDTDPYEIKYDLTGGEWNSAEAEERGLEYYPIHYDDIFLFPVIDPSSEHSFHAAHQAPGEVHADNIVGWMAVYPGYEIDAEQDDYRGIGNTRAEAVMALAKEFPEGIFRAEERREDADRLTDGEQ